MLALRSEVVGWLERRRGDVRFRRFGAHFDALGTVLLRMLDRLNDELDDLPADPGSCYERCRWLDGRLALVRALFDWYVTRYDQRLATSPHADLLRAADEVARGCWQEAFVAAGIAAPTGPLCYVEIGTDGHSLRRCPVPGDFRVPEDDPLAEFLRRLPAPLVALPEGAVREPWWLVVVAHETGHHVQHDLGLTEKTVRVVGSAVPADLKTEWETWSGELFADVFSTLMVGEAAGWVVGELQFGALDHLVRPTGPYPPPVVRTAVLDAVLRELGADAKGEDPLDWVPDRVARHLKTVPAVVSAILGIAVTVKPLRSLADHDVLSTSGHVERWAAQLGRKSPVIAPLDTRTAPRLLLAAAVRRHRMYEDADPALAYHNLVVALGRSGAPGLLASGTGREVGQIADDLADLLLAED
ncbi:hypothetical protein [Kutzneria sp. NPDC052558]|uniref:hypothetical protein n=1 Tax=Kutzneria sp. NPDC052558 TaxID=3364121 RepID=UPI0037C5F58D